MDGSSTCVREAEGGCKRIDRKTSYSFLTFISIVTTFLLGPGNDTSWRTGNSLYFNLGGGYIYLLLLNHSVIHLCLVVSCACVCVRVCILI